MVRAVIDSNVHVSALLNPTSIPGEVIKAARDKQYQPVFSRFMMEELRSTLQYPKLKKCLKQSDTEIERYLTSFEMISEEIVDEPHGPAICRDPDDDVMLHVAMNAKAEFVVSGDKDLLILDQVQFVQMLTPADFLDVIGYAQS